eukprot:scaffold12440_cov35-Prasinocladus_malaysianus.AAC.1
MAQPRLLRPRPVWNLDLGLRTMGILVRYGSDCGLVATVPYEYWRPAVRVPVPVLVSVPPYATDTYD